MEKCAVVRRSPWFIEPKNGCLDGLSLADAMAAILR
jgi:hypothetical protein